jgi:hypothetical protein
MRSSCAAASSTRSFSMSIVSTPSKASARFTVFKNNHFFKLREPVGDEPMFGAFQGIENLLFVVGYINNHFNMLAMFTI